MESQKEELRLLAEREVARLEEEKRAQEHDYVTALRTCVCMSACLLACLLVAIYQKF